MHEDAAIALIIRGLDDQGWTVDQAIAWGADHGIDEESVRGLAA